MRNLASVRYARTERNLISDAIFPDSPDTLIYTLAAGLLACSFVTRPSHRQSPAVVKIRIIAPTNACTKSDTGIELTAAGTALKLHEVPFSTEHFFLNGMFCHRKRLQR